MRKVELSEPPPEMAPFECFQAKRSKAEGHLAATWYPALGAVRGAVLLLHPLVPWGQGYFHRRSRVPVLRSAGYHVLTVDLGGVGRSSGPTGDFYSSDLEDALHVLRQRAAGLPLHLWGVSAGGYWSHLVLSRRSAVRGAVFEDVSKHLIEWSKRMAPWGWPAYLFFQQVLPGAYRFLDLRRHAPFLHVRSVAYIGGEEDPGVLSEETRELADLAGARCLIVPGAGHLEAIKNAEEAVVALAMRTFELADHAS